MTTPKLSVCMITYNQERFIGQAVESALMQQTAFPLEIVVGEDCSTDGTRSVLEQLVKRNSGRIRLAIPSHNVGANRNLQQTLAQCRGQYVALLEGDDYWTCPHKLQRQVDALDARPDWAMCFHPAEIIHDDGRPPTRWPEHWDKPESTLVDLFDRDFIPTNSVVFRNRLFGEFPDWYFEQTMGDWTLHMLNAAHGNIGFLPEVMSVYRVHAGGLWSSMPHPKRMLAMLKMLSAVDRHFGGKYAGPIDQCRFNILSFSVNETNEVKAANDRLLEENRELRKFHDAWSNSLAYKATRELKRPFIDVRDYVARRVGGRRAAPSPPQ